MTKIFFVHVDSIVSVVSVAWRFRSLTHPHHVNYPVFCSSCHGGGQHITFVPIVLSLVCWRLYCGGLTGWPVGWSGYWLRTLRKGDVFRAPFRTSCHRRGCRLYTTLLWCRGNFPDLGWICSFQNRCDNPHRLESVCAWLPKVTVLLG